MTKVFRVKSCHVICHSALAPDEQPSGRAHIRQGSSRSVCLASELNLLEQRREA